MAPALVVPVRCRHAHEYQGEHREHECLDCCKEDFQEEEGRLNDGKQAADYCHQDRPGEHTAEETEGERDNAGEFGDQFQQADEDVN